MDNQIDEIAENIMDDVARTVEFKTVDASGGVFPVYGKELKDRTKQAIKSLVESKPDTMDRYSKIDYDYYQLKLFKSDKQILVTPMIGKPNRLSALKEDKDV